MIQPPARPAQPATPIARPVSPAPAVPAVPAVPADVDVEPLDVEELDGPASAPEPEPLLAGGPLVRARGPVTNRWSAVHFVVLFLALAAIGGVVAFVILYVPHDRHGLQGFLNEDGAQTFRGLVRNLKNDQESAFKLIVPEGQWQILDKGTTARFTKSILGLKHARDDSWFVIAVDDYGMQRPRESELMKVAVDSLESYFGPSLELANKTEPSTLGGQEAMRLRFKGTINAVVWSGEVHMLAHHGFGYWLYVAAPTWDEAEQVKAELETGGKGLVLHTERRGWREQPPKMETFRAGSAPMTLAVPEGVWEKTSAKDEEETGELFLFGRFKREKDNRKNAALLVFSIDKQADLHASMKAARAYVEKRKQEENAKYKLIAAEEGAETGELTPVGDRPGCILELKLILGDETRRYYLLAVVHRGDRAFVARGDCVWEHRQIWRQDFLNALATLRFTEAE